MFRYLNAMVLTAPCYFPDRYDVDAYNIATGQATDVDGDGVPDDEEISKVVFAPRYLARGVDASVQIPVSYLDRVYLMPHFGPQTSDGDYPPKDSPGNLCAIRVASLANHESSNFPGNAYYLYDDFGSSGAGFHPDITVPFGLYMMPRLPRAFETKVWNTHPDNSQYGYDYNPPIHVLSSSIPFKLSFTIYSMMMQGWLTSQFEVFYRTVPEASWSSLTISERASGRSNPVYIDCTEAKYVEWCVCFQSLHAESLVARRILDAYDSLKVGVVW